MNINKLYKSESLEDTYNKQYIIQLLLKYFPIFVKVDNVPTIDLFFTLLPELNNMNNSTQNMYRLVFLSKYIDGTPTSSGKEVFEVDLSANSITIMFIYEGKESNRENHFQFSLDLKSKMITGIYLISENFATKSFYDKLFSLGIEVGSINRNPTTENEIKILYRQWMIGGIINE